MTRKQRLFISEYLADLNGAKAAIRAGYSPKVAAGGSLMQKPAIRQAIEVALAERAAKAELTAECVLAELYFLVTAHVGMFEIADDGEVSVKAGYSPHYLTAVSSAQRRVTKDYDGKVREQTARISLFDKPKSVSLALRHFGLLDDRLTIVSPEAAAREMIDAAAAEYDAELARIASRKAQKKEELKN